MLILSNNLMVLLNINTWKIFEVFVKYFAFPQPTSKIIEPGLDLFKNFTTFGQGFWRVSLKWDAMFS